MLLFALEHGSNSNSVTALYFCTDIAAATTPQLTVGWSDGALLVWDLSKHTLVNNLVIIHKNHIFAYTGSMTRNAQCSPVLHKDSLSVSARKQAPPKMHHAAQVQRAVGTAAWLLPQTGGRALGAQNV